MNKLHIMRDSRITLCGKPIALFKGVSLYGVYNTDCIDCGTCRTIYRITMGLANLAKFFLAWSNSRRIL